MIFCMSNFLQIIIWHEKKDSREKKIIVDTKLLRLVKYNEA